MRNLPRSLSAVHPFNCWKEDGHCPTSHENQAWPFLSMQMMCALMRSRASKFACCLPALETPRASFSGWSATFLLTKLSRLGDFGSETISSCFEGRRLMLSHGRAPPGSKAGNLVLFQNRIAVVPRHTMSKGDAKRCRADRMQRSLMPGADRVVRRRKAMIAGADLGSPP